MAAKQKHLTIHDMHEIHAIKRGRKGRWYDKEDVNKGLGDKAFSCSKPVMVHGQPPIHLLASRNKSRRLIIPHQSWLSIQGARNCRSSMGKLSLYRW